MLVTVASFKGGVGKSTTAVHLATFLQRDKPTLLLDGDRNRCSMTWDAMGPGLPFKVCDEKQAARFAHQFGHCVIDTEANTDDFETLAGGCDLLVIPTTPDGLGLSVLTKMVQALREIKSSPYRVLLTMVPPPPENDGEEARAALEELGVPLFNGWVRFYKCFKKAVDTGVPVYGVKRDKYAKEAWSDYEAIGKEVLNGQR